jgi:hypothetical protein
MKRRGVVTTAIVRVVPALLSLLLLVASGYPARAGGGPPAGSHQLRPGQPIRFEYLTVEDGLPDNSVASILQDRQGFLWFGTKNGLSRYDGAEFTTYAYDPADPDSLSYNFVWCLLEDRVGNIWVGTLGGGLNKFDPVTETFVRYQHDEADPNSLSHNFVWSIYEDDGGALWIATDGGGLNRFNPASETFVRYQHDEAASNSLGNDLVRVVLPIQRAGRDRGRCRDRAIATCTRDGWAGVGPAGCRWRPISSVGG